MYLHIHILSCEEISHCQSYYIGEQNLRMGELHSVLIPIHFYSTSSNH